MQNKKETALQYLEKVAEEIAAEHRNHVCNHYGACKYVGPFVEYMQKNPDDAHDFEAWAEEIGDYEKLYGAIFDGGARIDEAPEHHVSDVARFHEICRAHGIIDAGMVNLNGQWVDFDTAVQLMNDELRVQVHAELAPCTNQQFLDRYVELHREKYGEDFGEDFTKEV